MYILMPLRAVEFEEGAPGGNNRYRYIQYEVKSFATLFKITPKSGKTHYF